MSNIKIFPKIILYSTNSDSEISESLSLNTNYSGVDIKLIMIGNDWENIANLRIVFSSFVELYLSRGIEEWIIALPKLHAVSIAYQLSGMFKDTEFFDRMRTSVEKNELQEDEVVRDLILKHLEYNHYKISSLQLVEMESAPYISSDDKIGMRASEPETVVQLRTVPFLISIVAIVALAIFIIVLVILFIIRVFAPNFLF